MAEDDGVRIRTAEKADLPAITAIYNEAILNSTATFDTEVKTTRERAAWLAAHDARHPVLVIEAGGAVVGWVSLSRWSDRQAYAGTGEITYYVEAEHRGKGYGRSLQDAIIRHAREQGFHTLLARITAGNEASLRMCRRAGFTEIGLMKAVGHKFGGFLDVHLLQLMLD